LSKLKVLAISNGFWRGGAQEFTLDMIRLLQNAGVEVNVITSEKANASYLNDLKTSKTPTFKIPSSFSGSYPEMAIDRCSKLVESSDIVWITDIEYLAAPAVKRIKKKIPVIASLHSFALTCPKFTSFFGMHETCTKRCSVQRIIRCRKLSSKYELKYFKLRSESLFGSLLKIVNGPRDFSQWAYARSRVNIMENIDCFAPVSSFLMDQLLRQLPYLKGIPYEVIPNPISVPALNSKQYNARECTILYASGSQLAKGPHIALNSAKHLLSAGFKDFKLVMLAVAGCSWIEREVQQLRLQKNVVLLPRVSRNETYKHMSESKLILMPTVGLETFGRIPVEANLLGTPAVVSNLGALPEAITEGTTGFSCVPLPEEFGRKTVKALETSWDSDVIRSITKAKFDPELALEKFLRLLGRFS
jgi:glycosyltransferase involved in cell wall biosynthesis